MWIRIRLSSEICIQIPDDFRLSKRLGGGLYSLNTLVLFMFFLYFLMTAFVYLSTIMYCTYVDKVHDN